MTTRKHVRELAENSVDCVPLREYLDHYSVAWISTADEWNPGMDDLPAEFKIEGVMISDVAYGTAESLAEAANELSPGKVWAVVFPPGAAIQALQ
jgi:hypothetical protein